jgi:hypothetical protein
VAAIIPLARHVRTGLHRRRGYTPNLSSVAMSPPATGCEGREDSERFTPDRSF